MEETLISHGGHFVKITGVTNGSVLTTRINTCKVFFNKRILFYIKGYLESAASYFKLENVHGERDWKEDCLSKTIIIF